MGVIIGVHYAVIGPGRQLKEFDLAVAGAESGTLCLARVREASLVLLCFQIKLDVVHLDIVPIVRDVGCSSTVIFFEDHVGAAEHLIPAAAILLHVEVFDERRTFTEAAVEETGDEPCEPDHAS